MGPVEILSLIAIFSFVVYKWATLKYKTFEERRLHFEPPIPLIGNSLSIIMNKESFFQTMLEFYRRNKTHKIFGYFNFREPVVIVNDPEAVKKITVKDFESFPNHQAFFYTENDRMLDSMLSIMKDQRWKDMRNTLSPVFTAAKIRVMYPLMNECFAECLTFLREKLRGGQNDIELKEICTRLSNDLIATTAFGLKINSYVDRDNEFYKIGSSITNFRGKQMLKFWLSTISPKLMAKMGVRLFDTSKTEYFLRLVVDAMKYREANNIQRPDMIQLLMEAKKESPHNWSDEELVGQCFVFFFAAFENNANLICTTSHELMLNPDIQERLYEEILEVNKRLNGKPLDYETVNNMKYMDMVVSESLRKWPLAPMTDRVCSKDYNLIDDDDNSLMFEFKQGDKVWIPIVGFHYNEDYFESPEIFDPERFSDDNKGNIKPGTYIPFGIGPRICIGNRFALMQAKAMLYYLLLNFKLERSPKTVTNLLETARGFQLNPVNGFQLRLTARN